MKAMLSGNLATMVPGVPYAIAAKFAFPDRVSVAMVGDGAMQMGGMAEMLTAAQVLQDMVRSSPHRARAQQRGSQSGHLGATCHGRRPALRRSQSIPYMDFAAYANLIGLKGIKVSTADEIENACGRSIRL